MKLRSQKYKQRYIGLLSSASYYYSMILLAILTVPPHSSRAPQSVDKILQCVARQLQRKTHQERTCEPHVFSLLSMLATVAD